MKASCGMMPCEMFCGQEEAMIEQQNCLFSLSKLKELSAHNRLPQYCIAAEEHDTVRPHGSTFWPSSFVGFDIR